MENAYGFVPPDPLGLEKVVLKIQQSLLQH